MIFYCVFVVQVSGYCGLLLGSPIILYEIIAFIIPGLTKEERKFLGPIVLGSSVLFYAGITFSYLVLVPAALNFFVNYAEGAVESLWSIDQYFEFVLVLMFSTGLSFQVISSCNAYLQCFCFECLAVMESNYIVGADYTTSIGTTWIGIWRQDAIGLEVCCSRRSSGSCYSYAIDRSSHSSSSSGTVIRPLPGWRMDGQTRWTVTVPPHISKRKAVLADVNVHSHRSLVYIFTPTRELHFLYSSN